MAKPSPFAQDGPSFKIGSPTSLASLSWSLTAILTPRGHWTFVVAKNEVCVCVCATGIQWEARGEEHPTMNSTVPYRKESSNPKCQ